MGHATERRHPMKVKNIIILFPLLIVLSGFGCAKPSLLKSIQFKELSPPMQALWTFTNETLDMIIIIDNHPKRLTKSGQKDWPAIREEVLGILGSRHEDISTEETIRKMSTHDSFQKLRDLYQQVLTCANCILQA
ncbi:MAG: hypothetical protein AAB796_01820 [Patescibacteria group bacterium]